MHHPIVDKTCKLEKFAGAGGWTYAPIPEVKPDKSAPFGWVKVRGSIDGTKLDPARLMPMGNGNLFLPVKAELRKKLRKKAGDEVRIILYLHNDPIEIPSELVDCLNDEPIAKEQFEKLTEAEKESIVRWIYSARQPSTRTERIARTIDRLLGKSPE